MMGRIPRWGETERVAFLTSVRLFAPLPPAILAQIARHFRPRHVQRGEFVFLKGLPATDLNLLVTGRIKVVRETEDGREVILRQIGPGDIFGGAGGWGESVYPASALAQEDAVVLQLPAAEFKDLLSSHVEFAFAVIHELGLRLREAESRIRDLQAESAECRLAHALLRLAQKQQVGGPATVTLTRQDLAELAGTTISTASRMVSLWRQQGIIAAGRERLTILRPDALLAIAEATAEPTTRLKSGIEPAPPDNRR
jgi:CRP-like cAMP-binding protein